MSVKQASVHAKWIIGRVIGTKMYKTAKVRVTRLVLDPYLLKVNRLTVSFNAYRYRTDRLHGCYIVYFPNKGEVKNDVSLVVSLSCLPVI